MSSSFQQQKASRRGLLKGMLAGAAVAVPAAGSAEAASNEEQLETCLTQLRAILARMHPGLKSPPRHSLYTREDGSFRLDVRGDVAFMPFEGDGIYDVSMDGHVLTYWVREERIISSSGKDMGYSHYYGRMWYDGAWDSRERFLTGNFVRKLESVL